MGKHSQKKAEKMIGTKLSFKEDVELAEKGTAYPATIDTLKKIVRINNIKQLCSIKDKQ